MFTKDSLSIQKYIEQNSKLPKNGFHELKLLYKYLNEIQNPYEVIKTNINDNKKHLHFTNPFISKEISHNINSLNSNYNLILKINNNQVTINIYHNEKNINKFVSNIIIVVSYIVHLLKKKVGNININYYLTDYKKVIDGNLEDGLNHGHVNNGCCSPMTNTIDIWRKEEVMKVTIHELFHLFNCDKSMNDNSFIINMYKNRYNINSERVNTFEAYTEIWANILNCYFLSKNDYKKFVKYIYLEKQWASMQASKIFYLTNLDKKHEVDINKYTNVLAYFIIRCELYNDFKLFIKYFGSNICCDSNKYFLFLKNINKCKMDDKFIKKISKKNYIYKSLRMSGMEINLF